MKKKIVLLAFWAVFCMFAVQSANAATVTFQDFSSVHNLFQPPSPSVTGDTLSLDVSLFTANAPWSDPIMGEVPYNSKTDTIYFNIIAPTGYYIDTISYGESLTANLALNGGFGFVSAEASAVIAGQSMSFGSYFNYANAHKSFLMGVDDYSVLDMKLTSLGMSITNQITAIAFNGAITSINKNNYATVTVTLQEIPSSTVPVPASIWLLGSAVTGLVGLRRNRS